MLKEAYRNDLGQTAESWLNLTINNRPAPAFSFNVKGNGNSTDEACLITMIPNMAGVDFPLLTRFGPFKANNCQALKATLTIVLFYQQVCILLASK